MEKVLSCDQVQPALVRHVVENLFVEWVSNSQVVLKDGALIGSDDGSVIMQVSGDITVDITASGVNGLDTGSEAPSTWYFIYLIHNPSSGLVRGLLSVSTTPVLPSGYTEKRYVGFVRNDGSSNFRRFIQNGRYVSTTPVSLISGAMAVPSYIPFDVSIAIPSGSIFYSHEGHFQLHAYETATSGGVGIYLATTAGGEGESLIGINGDDFSQPLHAYGVCRVPLRGSNLYFKLDPDIWAVGYIDAIGYTLNL